MSRWLVAIMGTLLQVCLGTVYAWSFFQKPIMSDFGWNTSQVMWIFSLAICFLGLASAWGGINLPKYGPTKLAMGGGLLYGAGYLLAALAMQRKSLVLFYLAFGAVGGVGLGLGYVTPVATSAKWFPDRKGFVTGMVVMGFGLGALAMSKVIAPSLMKATGNGLIQVFLLIVRACPSDEPPALPEAGVPVELSPHATHSDRIEAVEVAPRRSWISQFAPTTLSMTTPCLGTLVAVYESLNAPRSFCPQRSRTAAAPGEMPSALHCTVMDVADSVRLKSATARAFVPDRGFDYTSRLAPGVATILPCTPRGSWSTSITSLLVRMLLDGIGLTLGARPGG
jgi:MFS family permease